jgi:hypothetical protein
MIPTPHMIELLADGLTPVRRLRGPMTRAARWLLLASMVTVLLVVAHGVRPDFWQCLLDQSFVVCTAASIATGISATVAAFLLGLPDRSRAWALLPLPALAVWLSAIGYQCLTNWVALEPDGLLFDAGHDEPAARDNHPRHAPARGAVTTGVGDADGGFVGISDHRHRSVADP